MSDLKEQENGKNQVYIGNEEVPECINYTNMLYKDIGKRVKENLNEITQTSPSGKKKRMSLQNLNLKYKNLDPSTLSRVQNGIADKSKNPYLMSLVMLQDLTNLFDVDEYELIWGDKKSREHYVKTWLLAILVNGAKHKVSHHKKYENKAGKAEYKTEYEEECINPFCCADSPRELFEFAKQFPEFYQKYFPERSKEFVEKFFLIDFSLLDICDIIEDYEGHVYPLEDLQHEAETFFLNRFGFFGEKEDYERYKLLEVQHDDELTELSDAIFRLLLQNYDFTTVFVNSATTRILNQRYIPEVQDSPDGENEVCKNLKDLLFHPSKYILEAMDYKGRNYVYFMDAFNSMWEQYKGDIVPFFQSSLFHNKILPKVGLKAFQNRNFDAIIKSKDLLALINLAPDTDVYLDERVGPNLETMLAETYFMQKIQAALLYRYSTFFNNSHFFSMYDSMLKCIAETEKEAQKLLKSNRTITLKIPPQTP